jgi:carboxymethylenebutenolidase
MLTRRSVIALLAVGIGIATVSQEAPAQGSGYRSGGRAITVERFDAPQGGRRPAVLLLHGSDGPSERYRTAARQVAQGGYHVFLVHYLDRTGETRASFGSIARNFGAWTDTAQDGIGHVARQPGVDPARIGVLGVSLGGGLGIALAAQDRRVRALVDYYGFVPSGVGAAAALPPTLILHGASDRVVPVANARALQDLLRSAGIPFEIQIYPGQGHGFTGAAQADATRRIKAFFGRKLGAQGALSRAAQREVRSDFNGGDDDEGAQAGRSGRMEFVRGP